MPAIQLKTTHLHAFTLLALSIFASSAGADELSTRIDSLDQRLTRIETLLQVPPATQPSTPPDPQATPVRADTLPELRAAIQAGATWVQTTGVEIGSDFDARGALIELLPGGPGWKPAIALGGDASLVNATIKTPPSTYNAAGQRTGFFKALTATGRSMTLRNVTFSPESGFCIHLFKGTLVMESVKATTFSEYFIFQEADTFASARWCVVKGGSKAESVWRTSGGNYLIEESVLDNSAGGKAVLRGDSPGKNDEPGGIARRTRFVGQVGPNPLTEDDGGQMLGIDRWRFAEGWIYQLDYQRKQEAIDFARRMYLNGERAEQIVRATADKFIDGPQFAKVAKGKTRLTDADIKLTLDLRAKEVRRHSRILIEDCEIIGDAEGKASPLRLNARTTGTIRRTLIQSNGANTPISGNSQQAYPFPVDRVIVGGEQQLAPEITFDGVEIKGGPALGIDPKRWRSLKFINGSTYQNEPIAFSPVYRIYNSSPIDIDGVTRIRTDGGLTYINAMGQEVSAWVGGYDGPGGTGPRPAPWTTRWREYDETRLRAYARALKGPVFVLNIEHWEIDPAVHGQETARRWLDQLAAMCRTIKQERPDILVGCYDILPASNYWTLVNWGAWQRWKSTGVKNNDLPDEWWSVKEAEYRNAYYAWQKRNDFTASILLDHVDVLFPSVYPSYRMRYGGKVPAIKGSLVMDSDVVQLAVEEAHRISKGKPVYPFYWPIITEDGGEVADAARTKNTIEAAMNAGAAGVVVWSDQRPRDILEQTIKATIDALEPAPSNEE